MQLLKQRLAGWLRRRAERSTAKAAASGAARPWRQRVTIAGAVTWVVVAAILAAGGSAGYYAFTVLYNSKLIDTWAIMFFELEQEGSRLADRFRIVMSFADEGANAADIVLQLGKDGQLTPLQGPVTRVLSARDLGFTGKALSRPLVDITLAELAGERYLMAREQDHLRLRKVGPEVFAAEMGSRTHDDAETYLVTTEGKLLYSNSAAVRGIDYVRRPLVQKFIAAPLTQGQLEFTNDKGEACYGFFLEIPASNLVLFSEVTRAKALATVQQVMLRYLGVLLGILALVVALLQVPLRKLTGPLRELAELAARFGRGDFTARATRAGFGEVSRLTGAFNTMADNIVARDQAIRQLMVEQAEKIRLEAELNIARGIQGNLLPSFELPASCGLEVKARYIPATECAGDWYSFHHDPVSGETVVVLADVSGHGAGASMFTAIIAGLFDQYCNTSHASWPLEDFARAAHGVILRLGKAEWYATMLMVRHRVGRPELDILFASHPPPFLHLPSPPVDGSAQTRRIPGPSTPIGMNMEFKGLATTIPFPRGAQLLLFTDGLLEARNNEGRQFGQRLIRKAFASDTKGGEAAASPGLGSAGGSVDRVIDAWKDYRGAQPADDDTCVIVLRAL